MQNIKELDSQKKMLSIEVDKLVAIKKRLYSNMDIESPMSIDEKELNKKIYQLYSEIFQIIKQKRNILKAEKAEIKEIVM
jgi:hypothetical protein